MDHMQSLSAGGRGGGKGGRGGAESAGDASVAGSTAGSSKGRSRGRKRAQTALNGSSSEGSEGSEESEASRVTTTDHALQTAPDRASALGLDDDEDSDSDDGSDGELRDKRRARSAEKKKKAQQARLQNFLDDDDFVDSHSVANQSARARDAAGGSSDDNSVGASVERVPLPQGSNLGGIDAVDKEDGAEERAWAEKLQLPRDTQPCIRYHTPVCEKILNEFNPCTKRFNRAFLEMQQKWVGCFNRTQQDWISQLLINFNLSWNAEKVRLKFKTNKAEQPHPNDRFRRKKKKKKKGGGHGGDGTDTDDSKDSDEAEDDDDEEGVGKCVYGNEAIQHAFETEVHLAFFLWAYCNVEVSLVVRVCARVRACMCACS